MSYFGQDELLHSRAGRLHSFDTEAAARGVAAEILTLHFREDRGVKTSVATERNAALYSQSSTKLFAPGAAERNPNPRSSSSKLR